jgi:hypothetical protein
MKKALILCTLIALLALLTGCGASKKVVKTTSMTFDSVQVNKSASEQTRIVIDTTKTENGKVTITEITFCTDTSGTDADITLDGIGNVKGKIKSIKQSMVETSKTDKGQSEESSQSESRDSSATVAKMQDSVDKTTIPAIDPYRWRYIIGIVMLGAIIALLLYLKRTPIVNWLKKMLSCLKKFL